MKIQNVPIDKINIGERFRTDHGDLESLAANIAQMGLLQPIGIDQYHRLIFGRRRMLACGEILKWETIPCITLNLDSLLAGQYAENEFRKQFTISERVAIGKAVEAELGNRRGANLPNSPKHSIAANADTGKTVDIAAKRASFKSAETFERAKAVIDNGSPELIAAMDSDELSINASAKIATQPKEEQTRIAKMPKDERREVLRHIGEDKAEREAQERATRDLDLFGVLYDAVQFISRFHEEPKETWAGLWRMNGFDFPDLLPRAIQCLVRLEKAEPNARKPELVDKKAK